MRFEMLNRGYDSESPVVDETVQQLGDEIGLVRKEQYKALKMILLNLYFSDTNKVGVSRSKNTKIARYMNPLVIGQRGMITILDRLHPIYINREVGSKADKKTTLISPTIALSSYLLKHDWSHGTVNLITNHQPVRLRDSYKNEINYEDTSFTSSVRQFLWQYMGLLEKTKIIYMDKKEGNEIDCPEVRRIFNRSSFQRGGRIFGPWTDVLEKTERGTLKIDNETTVELDFSASTLNILYRIETGKKCPYDEPYPVTIRGTQVPKKYCKKLIIISMNVGSASTTSRVFKQELNDVDLKEFEALGITTRELHQAIEDKHNAIYDNFYKGIDFGLWLQFVESELVFSILKRLTSECIPALTVHDSFIVKKRDEQYVKRLMDEMPDTEVERIVQSYPYRQIVS